MVGVQRAVLVGALLGSLVVMWVGMAAGGLVQSLVIGGEITQTHSQPVVSVEAQAAELDPARANCQVSSSFPEEILQWCEPITAIAAGVGLDPDLVAAVMLQESGGDPEAISGSGAVGLLQVMPRDGVAAEFQCINGPCFANRPAAAELADPEFNLKYGIRMLSGLFGKFGDWREALKAYGPMDVGYTYADKVLSIYAAYR